MDQIKNLMPGRAAIIKPRSVLITTRYFWQKWRPLLGNSLAMLVIEARRKCYRNLATGEVRDWFYSTMEELSQTVGFSPKKIMRLLKLPHAQKFIRYKPTYVYSPDIGKKVHGKCLFKVSLDDPLIPDDEVGLVSQEIQNSASFQIQPKAQFDPEPVSLETPPAGQHGRNSYSTFQEINININNTAVTYGPQGEVVLVDHRAAARPKELEVTQVPYPISPAIIQKLGASSVLLRTILRSCTIVAIRAEQDSAVISIGAPNIYYKRVLELRLKENLTRILEQKTGRRAILEFITQSATSSENKTCN